MIIHAQRIVSRCLVTMKSGENRIEQEKQIGSDADNPHPHPAGRSPISADADPLESRVHHQVITAGNPTHHDNERQPQVAAATRGCLLLKNRSGASPRTIAAETKRPQWWWWRIDDDNGSAAVLRRSDDDDDDADRWLTFCGCCCCSTHFSAAVADCWRYLVHLACARFCDCAINWSVMLFVSFVSRVLLCVFGMCMLN